MRFKIAIGITILGLLLLVNANAATITVPDDYAKIQWAIDNATAGDVIEVHSGTYYENVNGTKQLTLRGIGMPVVNASRTGSAITLAADGITLEGFTAIGRACTYTEVLLSGEGGIKVTSNNNKLSANNVYNDIRPDLRNDSYCNGQNIILESSNNNTLIGNNVSKNSFGIWLNSSNNNTLIDNNASSNYGWFNQFRRHVGSGSGIYLGFSSNNKLISNNANSNAGMGIYLKNSNNNTMISNNANFNVGMSASNVGFGIVMSSSSNNTLIGNKASNNGLFDETGSGISSDSSNNTLIGNNVSNNRYGISMSGSNHSLICNNVSDNEYGIELGYSGNNTLIGNNVISNYQGIYLHGFYQFFSSNNLIYNNTLNNTINFYFSNSNNNHWNIPKQSGPNIIGGPYLGGNFWANPSGTGFSQTCSDVNSDGICDEPYVLDYNNTDYLPLSRKPPYITFTHPTPANRANFNQDYAYINTTVSDSSTAFIDWSRSLIGWWRFNNESGETLSFFKDSSNLGNNGTCSGINCPSLTHGKFGNALDMDGNGDKVTVPGLLGNPVDISFVGWGNLNATDITGSELFSVGDVFGLRVDASSQGGLLGYYFNGTDWTDLVENTPTLRVGTGWHQYAFTFSGSNNRQKLFVDDTLVYSGTYEGDISYAGKGPDTIFGAHGYGLTNKDWGGMIDEFRFFNRELSFDEIKASYDAGNYRLFRNFTDLATGSYNYRAYVQNLAGSVNQTETRTLNLITSSDGFLTKWGISGTGDGQFHSPNGIAIDSSGNVYVVDTGNDRIQKFNSSGAFISKWGSYGSGNGQFSYPQGIAADSSGNVYVADTVNHRIQKFSSTGVFITKWGSNGIGNGQFTNPQGIAVDNSGNFYVADTDNHRIQTFSSTGVFSSKWGSSGTGDGQFILPQGIAVDGSRNVYVADTNNNRTQKFSSTGVFSSKWGSPGTGNGQFIFPVGIAVDGSSIYVSDSKNHRIQKFISGIQTTGLVHNINTGTNYTTIQAAIDGASAGDEIRVDNGTYYENVNVTKQLTLRGIGMPVVKATLSVSTITLSADGITLEGFTATVNPEFLKSGINVISNNNTLINNIVSNSGNFGIYLSSSANNILISNKANSNNIEYGGTGITLSFSNNNTLIGNNASHNGNSGINLISSSNNMLIGNIANTNEGKVGVLGYGFYLFASSNNNTLIGNNASLNKGNGIYLENSSNNNMFHNNIINNTNQAQDNTNNNSWDNGYPSGGNYWGDYPGVDLKKGPNQNFLGSDGIGDTPYPIAGGSSVDRYPLMAQIPPGTPVESITGEGTVYFDTDTGTIQDLTAVNPGDIPETPPLQANLNYGLFRFNLTGVTLGGSATLTIVFPIDLQAGTTYWKYGANATNSTPHWYTIPSIINGKKITISLFDGGEGDDDLVINGRIRDDGGPSLPSSFIAPVADCSLDKLKCENIGTKVQFNGTASYDTDGTVVSYAWEFGDGGVGSGTAPNHTYAGYKWNGSSYQPFMANLTVTDNSGSTNSSSQNVVIWIAGDANGDGRVDILDASIVGLKWNGNDACADLNNDGSVNILDASIIGLNWGNIP